MAKRKACVNKDNCVACGACCKQCPREAITIFKGCYSIVDSMKCIGCGLCSRVCPANAIELVDVKQEEINGCSKE